MASWPCTSCSSKGARAWGQGLVEEPLNSDKAGIEAAQCCCQGCSRSISAAWDAGKMLLLYAATAQGVSRERAGGEPEYITPHGLQSPPCPWTQAATCLWAPWGTYCRSQALCPSLGKSSGLCFPFPLLPASQAAASPPWCHIGMEQRASCRMIFAVLLLGGHF